MQQDIKQITALDNLPLIPCHGDFTLTNIWITDAGQVCPVDWEEASQAHWPLMDLTVLAFDLSIKYRRVAHLENIRVTLHELFATHIQQLELDENTGTILSRIVLLELLSRLVSRGSEKAVRHSFRKAKPLDFL